jgi:threonine/homoserine/homoserine lactone efflux protein
VTIPTLGLFFVTVLGVIALPGTDMAFVLASALAGGRRDRQLFGNEEIGFLVLFVMNAS